LPAPGDATIRYEKGRKSRTRRHIIEVAAQRFRTDGVAAAGVAGLMADAGLTNGAFYAHCESQEELVREALCSALDQRKEALQASVDAGLGSEAWIRRYLSPRHRDAPADGCFTAALVAEIARRPQTTRDAFALKFNEAIDVIAHQLPGGSARARRRTATALYGMVVGTLQLARAVGDRKLADEILANGIEAALVLVRRLDDAPGAGSGERRQRGQS